MLELPVMEAPGLGERIPAEGSRTRLRPLLPAKESLVVLQSLKQSRQIWLTRALVKYPGGLRHLRQEPSSLGACDLAVGPHIFPNTKFWEVTAHSQSAYPSISGSPVNSQSSTSEAQSSSRAHPTHTANLSLSPPDPLETILASCPTLAGQVLDAASNDVRLTDLPSRGSEGNASLEEEKLLDRRAAEPAQHDSQDSLAPIASPTTSFDNTPGRIQTSYSLAAPPRNDSSSRPATNVEIVLEFIENPSSYFVLPLSGSVVKLSKTNPSDLEALEGRSEEAIDIVISGVHPFAATDAEVGTMREGQQTPDCHPVTIRLTGASPDLWQAIANRIQVEDQIKTARVADILDDMLNYVPTRVFLQPRLPEGSVVDGIRDEVFGGSNPHKRRRSFSASEFKFTNSVEPKSKRRKYPPRPSGRQVEVVIPLRRSKGTSAVSSGTCLPPQSVAPRKAYPTRPTPGLIVEVMIPYRRKGPRPGINPQTLPSTPKQTDTAMSTEPHVTSASPSPSVPSRSSPTATAVPQEVSGRTGGQVPYLSYYVALATPYPGPSAFSGTTTNTFGVWQYPWSTEPLAPSAAATQALEKQSGGSLRVPFVQRTNRDSSAVAPPPSDASSDLTEPPPSPPN